MESINELSEWSEYIIVVGFFSNGINFVRLSQNSKLYLGTDSS